MQDRKPLVVGLGEVGSALAAVLESAGPVLRHDLEPVEIFEPVGVMHVCFPYYNDKQFKASVQSYICRFNPSLVVINSTVVPGTTREIARMTGVAVAYSPVRGKHIKMAEDLRHYTKFVSALTPAVAHQVEDHFQAAGMKTAAMERPETLELAKLAETTYFGLQITFAQELNRFAERVNADYMEATRFFEEIDFLPRHSYFPGFIGGHCVIPNINLLKRVTDSPLLQVMLESNELRRSEIETSTKAPKVESNGASGNAEHSYRVPKPNNRVSDR